MRGRAREHGVHWPCHTPCHMELDDGPLKASRKHHVETTRRRKGVSSFGIDDAHPVHLYTAPRKEGRLGPGERVGVWLSQGPLEKQNQ